MVIKKINNLWENFNPTNYLDNELYFEKLVRMAENLRKKKKSDQIDTKKNFQTEKPLRWYFLLFSIFVLILLTEQTTCKYFISNFVLFYFKVFVFVLERN